MKILPLITLFLAVSSSLFSQPKKGNLLLGGGFSYSDIEEKATNLYDDQITSFSFNPSLNFYLGDFITFGVNFTYRNTDNTERDFLTSNNQATNFKSTIKTYFIGPVLSFQPKIINRLYFKGDIQFSFGFGNGNYRNNNSNGDFVFESEIDAFEFSITPGLIYFLSKRLAISGSFGGILYENGEEMFIFSNRGNSSETTETVSASSFGLNFNPANFNLSLFFLIGKNKSNNE